MRQFDRMAINDEGTTLGQRVNRYARVTTAMGGVAARLAGERLFGMGSGDATARQLKDALGGLKGPLMKVAQILSTIPGALPESYVKELSQLQANAPPMGWPFVKRRMLAELGPDWQARFATFEPDAAAAASLGQVHRAVLHDGRMVACKLQYPDMASAVEADLGQLRLIMGLYETYDRAVSTSEVHGELADRLREELDYTLEARNLRLYREMLRDDPEVSVPEPVTDLSTKRLLTMSWLEGSPIMNFVDSDLATRSRLSEAMFRAWYVPFYRFGIIHGDPHLGNYTVREDLGINLLDLGCIRVFRPQFVGGVIDLYHALRDDDRDLAAHAYETWGFHNLSSEMLEVLSVWAHFLYDPLLDDRVRPIGEAEHGVYGRETAERVHGELRRLGGVKIPREFVFMDRAALGLGSVFLRLRAELNWHRMFEELIGGFTADQLAARQDTLLGSVE